MFAELFLFAATRAGRTMRRAGLLTESVGLWSRGRRQRAAWAGHEKQCHAIVENAVAFCGNRRTVAVLGSGLCRDIPMPTLLAAFDRVLLVDAVHLPAVKLRYGRHPKIGFLARDLSGALDWMMGQADARRDPLADLRMDETIDLVISANMLSQLPIGPEGWLDKNPQRAAALPDDFLAHLVGWHLNDLRAWNTRVCLLTDIVMEERGRDGVVTDRLDLMRGHLLPQPDAQWEWKVAPFGEVDRAHEYVHRVHGYADFHAALAHGAKAPGRQAA